MSAYVVNPITINKIVAALKYSNDHPNHYPQIFAEIEDDILKFEDAADFGRTMYAMNINAVEQRYGDSDRLPASYDENDQMVSYKYDAMYSKMPSALLVYGALRCYLYQCSEGDVMELPLYKALQNWSRDLAMCIVENIPEYDGLWG
jgi:hypothetical protein